MNEMSVPMAFVDAVPVVLFFIACIQLMKEFYSRMTPAQYGMFSAGSIMVFLAGLMKVIWKFLYALEICDYAMLSDSFFPIQSAGFVLLAVSTAGLVNAKQKGKKLHSFAVPLMTTKMPFIALTFLGTTGWYASLCSLCLKRKHKIMCMFFIAAYGMDMMEVFLAAKFDESPFMHWVAEFVNIGAQTCLLTGALRLRKEYQEERYGY